jgi:hypothetical protein
MFHQKPKPFSHQKIFSCYPTSVVSVKKAVESLLENDLDMSDLYLSEGKTFPNILNTI